MLKKILTIALFIFSTNSYSAVNCTGTIEYMYISNSGQVIIYPSWRMGYTQICNITQTWGNVTAETCKGWISLVLTARTSSKTIRIPYPNGSYTCLDLPTYANAPEPVYVMILPD